MIKIVETVYMVITAGFLRGWPGRQCPDCRVRPGRCHRDGCPTGAWDGGVWA